MYLLGLVFSHGLLDPWGFRIFSAIAKDCVVVVTLLRFVDMTAVSVGPQDLIGTLDRFGSINVHTGNA